MKLYFERLYYIFDVINLEGLILRYSLVKLLSLKNKNKKIYFSYLEKKEYEI